MIVCRVYKFSYNMDVLKTKRKTSMTVHSKTVTIDELIEKMREITAVDSNVMYKTLAEEFGMSKDTIYDILMKNFNKRKVCTLCHIPPYKTRYCTRIFDQKKCVSASVHCIRLCQRVTIYSYSQK